MAVCTKESILSLPPLSPLYTLQNPFDKSPKRKYTKLLVMGSEEAEVESSSTPKLQLFLPPSPKAHEPEQPWTVASPLHTAASVPFRWEEEPGKPRPGTTLIIPTQKCLELPPRLLMDAETAKLSSPTTVLEGPYMGRSRFRSSSFSLKRESFRKNWSPQAGKSRPLVLGNGVVKGKGGFGSWRWGKSAYKGKCVAVGNHFFPSSSSVDGELDISIEDDDDESCKNNSVKMTKMKRSGSYPISTPARPDFWVSLF
ncbi:hypothetical protein HS088_TW18G00804 [Tripterygium wilfordii]|uniref:Uncharacterized protein n=1 Tax=Tripterygium wilfordii TaxID=458696 RepID=A0A7J7CDV7_TRIWF|nr:hypothetical protein HS088_TW18G00804 [Tripterygium wilfordii]